MEYLDAMPVEEFDKWLSAASVREVEERRRHNRLVIAFVYESARELGEKNVPRYTEGELQ